MYGGCMSFCVPTRSSMFSTSWRMYGAPGPLFISIDHLFPWWKLFNRISNFETLGNKVNVCMLRLSMALLLLNHNGFCILHVLWSHLFCNGSPPFAVSFDFWYLLHHLLYHWRWTMNLFFWLRASWHPFFLSVTMCELCKKPIKGSDPILMQMNPFYKCDQRLDGGRRTLYTGWQKGEQFLMKHTPCKGPLVYR